MSRPKRNSAQALIDAGPLIALFVPRESHHAQTLAFFRKNERELVSTWAVLAEAMHIVGRHSRQTQLDFIDWVNQGAIRLLLPDEGTLALCAQTMRRYDDLPMDLADATLIAAAMQTGLREIISLDSDFDVYRLPDRTRLKNLLQLSVH